jgi:transmembrane sensor
MKDNSKFDELLISYLSDELNEEDEAFVLQWINFDEQNKQYFEELKKVWRLLDVKTSMDQIDVTAEWNQFQQSIAGKQSKPAPVKQVETSSYQLTEDIKPAPKTLLYKVFLSIAIAASVLFTIALLSGFFNEAASPPDALARHRESKINSFPVLVRFEKNNSGKRKHFLLNDGTEIILSNNSELSYREPFAANTRQVTIKGKAYFKVAKDKTKPFTVFSGDLSTTVLGTRFTVTAYEGDHTITIRLYEGSVVVKSDVALGKQLRAGLHLLPGQELLYHNVSSTAKIRSFITEQSIAERKNNSGKLSLQPDAPLIPLNQKGSWYMFNNQSLDNVFQQLEIMYDVKIIYAKKDVVNKYFIGKFETTDSVENVLKQIASLNNLKVVKQDERFLITK